MNNDYTFSEFETGNENTLIPSNSNFIELLPFHSTVNLVYKIKINNKWLLLKRIVPEFREHPFYVSCLEKEFDIGFNLDHPNIVKYLNKGKDSDGTYLLAEYIDGATLRDFILKNPVGLKDEKWVLKIVKQLLDALDYLHKRQLFHLDLKPENLMITHKGNDLKIIDFGLSSSDSYSNFASGTKKYAAPEQFENPENSDASTDFYAVGLILLELFTGSTALLNVNKANKKYRRIILKAINQDKKDRYYTAADVLNDLNKNSFYISYKYAFGFVLLIVSTYFGVKNLAPFTPVNSKSNLPAIKNLKKTSLQSEEKSTYNQDIKKSEKLLDSVFTRFNKELEEKSSPEDSIQCAQLGEEIYLEFIKKMTVFDNNPTKRIRKLVLLGFKTEITDSIDEKCEFTLSNYSKGSIDYNKLNKIYNFHKKESVKKINAEIYL